MKDHPYFGDSVVRIIYFLDVDLLSGPFRACSADRTIEFEGKTFYGVGELGQIGAYQTKSGVEASLLKFSLQGIPREMAAEVMAEKTRNRRVLCYLCPVDEANIPLVEPILWFRGTIDSLSVQLGQSVTVAGSASSRLIHWAQTVNSRYTDEQQAAKYPGDRGFKFVAEIINLKLQWGS